MAEMKCLKCNKGTKTCVCGGFNCIDPICGAHHDQEGNLNSITDNRGRVVYKNIKKENVRKSELVKNVCGKFLIHDGS